MSQSDLQLWMRDETLARVGEVNDFDKFDAALRFNDASSWVLELPEDSPVRAAMKRDGRTGIIAAVDGEIVLSGPVVKEIRDQTTSSDTAAFAGVDDTHVLARFLALPSEPPFTSAAYDTRTAPAETVMHGYVEANLIAGAFARVYDGLSLAPDLGRGSSITENARFPQLMELLRSAAIKGGGLGFRVVQGDSGIEFGVYQPTDRTADFTFSIEIGTLDGFHYEGGIPEVNYIYGAGSGEGTSRLIVEGGDSASIAEFGRYEMFRDRRDTAIADEIQQTIAEELISGAAKASYELTLSDALRFGTDYGLGDLVKVVAEEIELTEVIREVTLSASAEGLKVTPLVGSAEASTKLDIFRERRQMKQRISQLERLR